jgi:hypothetical protein
MNYIFGHHRRQFQHVSPSLILTEMMGFGARARDCTIYIGHGAIE